MVALIINAHFCASSDSSSVTMYVVSLDGVKLHIPAAAAVHMKLCECDVWCLHRKLHVDFTRQRQSTLIQMTNFYTNHKLAQNQAFNTVKCQIAYKLKQRFKMCGGRSLMRLY